MDKYKYEHIFDLLKENFNFDEIKYKKYIKDIIHLLMESEKNGETFIDIDDKLHSFELEGDGWPEKHIEALEDTGLILSSDSPFILQDRKLSFIKWSKKVNKILNLLIKKLNNNQINQKIFRPQNKVNKGYKIIELFNKSDLVLLQGGPGTGKSTLILEIISYYLTQNHSINIGLSAPTGKASSRLKESLDKKKKSDLKYDLENIECQTLHRWIYNSINKSNKLKFNLKELDFFVIDEMSMVNINIIESILNLLADDCKLLLVGDANQLPPINNCSIWNYIFTYSKKSIFDSSIVNLKKVYRNNGDIEKLSKLIFKKEDNLFKSKVFRIMNNESSSNVNISKNFNKLIPEELIDKINFHINNLRKSVEILSRKKNIFTESIDNLYDLEKELLLNIFKKLNSQLVLCQTNSGIWSVNEINKIILEQSDHYDFFKMNEGIPVMCTENNNELGISNGDIGVIIGKGSLRRFLFRKFNKINKQEASLIEPNRLENIVPALAITIHKSQGSESDNVNILWKQNLNISDPHIANKSGILLKDNFEKRLFYTAITRAKKNLHLYYLNT